MTPAEFRTMVQGYADAGNLVPLWLSDRTVPFTQDWICLSPMQDSTAPRGVIIERKPLARKILAEFVAVEILAWLGAHPPDPPAAA